MSNITLKTIADATRKLALENKQASDELDSELPDEIKALFADDEAPVEDKDDEKECKDCEAEEAEDKEDDEDTAVSAVNALHGLKQVAIDPDEEAELGDDEDEKEEDEEAEEQDVQDLDDEETVLDLSSDKEEDEEKDEDDEEEDESTDECDECDKEDSILVSEDEDDAQVHTYTVFFDPTVPADAPGVGFALTCSDGDESAVSQISQIIESEANDFPIETVLKDDKDWYDEFNDILDELMADDRVYDYEVGDFDWIELDEEDDEEELDESALGDALGSIGKGIGGLFKTSLKGVAVLIAGLGGSFLFGLPGLLLAVTIAFGLLGSKESSSKLNESGLKDKLKTVIAVLKSDPKKSKELNAKMLAAKKAGDKEAMKKIVGEVKALADGGVDKIEVTEEESNVVKVCVHDIDWDVSDEDDDETWDDDKVKELGLPLEVDLEVEVFPGEVLSDVIVDALSDEYGYLISGFNYDIVEGDFPVSEDEQEEEDADECDIAEHHEEFKRDKWSDEPHRRGKPSRFKDDEEDWLDVDLDAEDLDLIDEEDEDPEIGFVEDPTDGRPEEDEMCDLYDDVEVASEGDGCCEDRCPDCGAEMREEPHTGNQRCPKCHHFQRGSYSRPSIYEEDDTVELSDLTADDIKSIQGMDAKAKEELTKMKPEEREETLQLLGVTNEESDPGVKDISTVAEVHKFLKECDTYSKSPALRRTVRRFERLVKESPLKAKALVKSLDKRFNDKPVSEKRFCAAFVNFL